MCFLNFLFIDLFLSYIYFYPQGVWDLGSLTRDQTHTPRPEIKFTSSALQDRFLTTGPPGKSHPPYSPLVNSDQASFG